MSNGVEISQHDRVTVVSLDRADVRNAVDAVTAQALHEAFVAFENDAEARVAVFHGANGHFCAGWDLQAGALIDPAAAQAMTRWCARMVAVFGEQLGYHELLEAVELEPAGGGSEPQS